MYRTYRVSIKVNGRLCGGVPKHSEMIEAWVQAKTGYADEQAQRIIDETTAEVATEELLDEVIAKNWTGFKSDDKGLYIEARQVKAMIKESANILKGVKGAKPIIPIKNLRARLAERVFVSPDRIYLGVEEPDGFEENAIHVLTAKGPRDSIKRVDYVEQPTVNFVLEVLDDGLITHGHLKTIFTHASRMGLGANRSQGYGQFKVLILDPNQDD